MTKCKIMKTKLKVTNVIYKMLKKMRIIPITKELTLEQKTYKESN